MSSLLKALKQQQSPLLKNSSVLDNALVASEGTSKSWRWLAWPLAITLGGMVGYAVAVWLDDNHQSKNMTASQFTWGESASVFEVTWEAKENKPKPVQVNASADEQPAPQQPAESRREALDLSSVSPELLNRFQNAVEQTEGSTGNSVSVVPSLSDLSAEFQRQVPEFSYNSHMYRSSQSQSWIELSGQRLYEGDRYQGLSIMRIEPHRVVLVLDSKAFSHPALEDWKR